MILFLCYVFPPLAVLLMGRPFSAVLNFFLWGFFFIPGIGHGLACYADYKGNKHTKTITRAINDPKWTKNERAAPTRARSSRKVKEAPVMVNSPFVGANGTRFKRK